MIVYPRYSTRRTYVGEQRVRRLLEAMEWEGAFAVHSANLPEHEYKRWGEIDFLVVTPSGLIAIEVKGGTVDYVDRVWRYANGRGRAIESTESPAAQCQSAVRALERQLDKRLDLDLGCTWGVAFPLSQFDRELAELPRARLADIAVCRDPNAFEAWLRNLTNLERYVSAIDDETMDALREWLVPSFSATASAGLALGLVAERVVELTRQQSEILDGLNDNPRLLVIGGAGTGKTELAVLTARAEALQGRSTALVVGQEAMVPWYARALAGSGVDVVNNRPTGSYDTLVVDEGQDFAFPEAVTTLFTSLAGGLERGRWRWFMDPNYQFLRRPPDPAALEALRRSATSFRLARNVRSTREIVEVVRAMLRADIGLSQIDGFGMPVRFVPSGPSQGADAAEAEFARLLESDVDPRQIAILSPRGADGPIGSELLRRRSESIDSFDARADPTRRTRAALAPIAAFRGLETAACLLVDLDELPEGRLAHSLLYVAMTRASASLSCIVDPVANGRLARLAIEAARED